VAENPATPLGKNAGRMIALKEIYRITDEGGAFFFKFPHGLVEGPDGSLYVRDSEQILRFDASGKFVRNYFKKGQGPGEMSYAGEPLPTARGLCVLASAPSKLVLFDDGGKLVSEATLKQSGRGSLRLVGRIGEANYFSSTEFPRLSGEARYFDVTYAIMSQPDGGSELKSLASFPVNSYVVSSPSGGGGMFSIAPFVAVPAPPKSLAVVHTSEYSVKVLDTASGGVARIISRKYERVESPPPKPDAKPSMIINGKPIAQPRQKYLNDITNVVARGETLWVITSTKDAKKGTLIDVFDELGRYVDCFYLNIPSMTYAIFKDVLYSTEKAQDETIVIKKYKIEWRD
jgi:hypothetical protein